MHTKSLLGYGEGGGVGIIKELHTPFSKFDIRRSHCLPSMALGGTGVRQRANLILQEITDKWNPLGDNLGL